MNKSKDSILFISDCSSWSTQAHEFLLNTFHTVTEVLWESGMPKNHKIDQWCGDWIISFKSDLILDELVICSAKKNAINFHPSSPKYRGIGGYQYAVDNRDEYFGATCHYMDKNVDHGKIIKTIAFEIAQNENSETLKQRTAAYCLLLFYEICIRISKNLELPQSDEKWGRKLYTKKDLTHYLENKRKTLITQN
jgi:phosphoribosylglycinamide formyltransferase-1